MDYPTKLDFISLDQGAYRKNVTVQRMYLHSVIIQVLENANDGTLSGACLFRPSKM